MLRSKNTVSKCKDGPTKTSSRKLTRQHPRRVTADLYCNIKQEIHLVRNDMVQSSKTRVVYCKAIFFSMKYFFLNFQSSTATGSSDVYSVSIVNILEYILISQIEFGLAHDSRSFRQTFAGSLRI
jgi:hypothetical protein